METHGNQGILGVSSSCGKVTTIGAWILAGILGILGKICGKDVVFFQD
jgi:hypothetical protein